MFKGTLEPISLGGPGDLKLENIKTVLVIINKAIKIKIAEKTKKASNCVFTKGLQLSLNRVKLTLISLYDS